MECSIYYSDFLGLPETAVMKDLKARTRFVAWDYHDRNGHITKPPLNPHTGQMAKVSDPTTWGSYEEASGYAIREGKPGVGIVLTGDEGIIGIDLDDCISDTDGIAPWVQNLLDLKETYAEVSPSGRGIRMLAVGKLEKAIKSNAAGIEVYGNGRYLTLTGNAVPGTPDEIRDAKQTLKRLEERATAVRGKQASSAKANIRKAASAARDGGRSLFRQVNECAMMNFDAWVPQLLPNAKPSQGGYRVSSHDLNRDLQEDLSIHENGIVDFGVADQGDSHEGKRTPIDLVLEYADEIDLELIAVENRLTEYDRDSAKISNLVRAAIWLCQKLNMDAVMSSFEEQKPELLLGVMNDKYCIITDGGKTQVLYFDDSDVGGSHRLTAKFLAFEEFKKKYQNRFVQIAQAVESHKNGKITQTTEMKNIPLGDWWLKHSDRLQYEGILFSPNKSKVVNGKLNLWRGFVQGDWSLMKRHIELVLGNDDPEQYDYILRWCAWAVQNPGFPAEAALVFKGEKGTGKSTLGNAMMKIFGQHGLQLSNVNHLIGHFNAHLRDACLVFADEAFWPGHKSGEGDLKRLITEPTLLIEAKGKDPESSTNALHIIMASNEEWIIPATQGERRYAVFEVSSCKQKDQNWFNPLYNELQNGGLEAMLFDLLRMDLRNFHPRDVPVTEALLNQQEEGLTPLEAWYRELLEEGTLPNSSGISPDWAYSDDLLNSAKESSSRLRDYFTPNKLGKFLKERRCKGAKKSHNRRGFRFPPLNECRAEWEKRYQGTTWDNDTQDYWTGAHPSDDEDFQTAFKEQEIAALHS